MGAYISKEYLIEKFNKLANDYTGEKRQRGLTYATAADMVALLPSADVAPIIHSKWEICSDGYYPYCSNCTERPNGELTKYCPNCGARMDGDSK